MATQEHLDRLRRGTEVWNHWNHWRIENPEIQPDLNGANLRGADLNEVNLEDANLYRANLIAANLSDANLNGADLSDADLNGADLSDADLSNANLKDADLHSANLHSANLNGANLSDANLYGANLIAANLSDANLNGADLSNANLSNADLSNANLSNANLSNANLSNANLSNANLSNANLSNANLSNANLSNANLYGASLYGTQALATQFNGATLTAACIKDWNINPDTNLQEVICEYIFAGHNHKNEQFTDRLPHDSTKFFAPGDFEKLLQESLDTITLIFREGLDWKSFAYSFQQLQVQYADEQISIQSIENKGDGVVVVKLAAAPTADKGNIEQFFWRGFEVAQKTLAGQYESRLEDKDKHNSQLFVLLQQFREQLGEDRKLMAENRTYDLRGSKFAGGFAAEGGFQTGGIFNDFSQTIEQNKNDIDSLIQALRGIAETFPAEKRDEVIVHLDDLEEDIQQPEKRKPNRVKARLAAMLAIAVRIGGVVATATDFANNVVDLSEKLGVPIEYVQPQSQPQQTIDVKVGGSDQAYPR